MTHKYFKITKVYVAMADGVLCIYQTLLNRMIAGAKITYKGETTDQVCTVSGKWLTLNIWHKNRERKSS